MNHSNAQNEVFETGVVDREQRRWFEDRHPRFEGRLLELYIVHKSGSVVAEVHWPDGRPPGCRRSWYGKLSTLLNTGMMRPGRVRGLRYRELLGEELERRRGRDVA